jgi:hypothetical protein
MKKLILAALVLVVVGPASLRADDVKRDPPTKAAKAFRVPFDTIMSQHMVVQVKLNGKGPYRMIFDTGAPFTLINNKVAKEAGVLPKDFKKPFFAPFGQSGQFKIDTAELGDVKASDLQTQVMDHPTVSAIASVVGPIEGIVGFNFFGKYRMTIDYQAKEMTFIPVDYEPKDMMKELMRTLLNPTKKAKVLVPAGQWGFRAAKAKDDAEAGVNVEEVYADTPAAKAGLKVGDRLLTLDGRWTDSVPDCFAAAAHVRPGAEARLRIRRDGKERELTLKVQPGV